jgi:hypothetical protein
VPLRFPAGFLLALLPFVMGFFGALPASIFAMRGGSGVDFFMSNSDTVL